MLNVEYYSPATQVRNEFYSGTHGALLAYDVTNRASFEALGSWLLEMRSHLADPDQDMASLVVVVCANKVCMYVRCSCCNVPYGWKVIWRGYRHLQMDGILLVPLPYAGTNSDRNVCVCVYAGMCVRTCMRACVYICVCEHVCTYVYVNMCVHMCM